MYTNENQTGYPSVDKPWLKYYSEEAINSSLFEGTVYDYLWESNKNHLARYALRYFGRRISFRELFQHIEEAAAAFQSSGIKEGDIVVISSVTTPETVYAFYALNRIGAVSNMVDPRTSIEGIRDYINEVGSETVIVIDAAYPKIVEAVVDTPVKRIIVTSPADSLPSVKQFLYKVMNREQKRDSNSITWRKLMNIAGHTTVEPIQYVKDKCCAIVHTGGTTGAPKGVMLSNDNVNALVQQSILTEIDMQRLHNWMDIMPPFIAYGIGMGLHLPLVIGMETILIPSFDAKKFDQLLIKHKPIHMVFVPSYWETIINSKRLKRADLSFIIAPTVGGDRMDTSLEMSVNQFLKDHGCSYKVTKGYGMTEVCAGVTGTLDAIIEVGSAGVRFVKTTISIFDPDSGEELQYNELGEICITGPSVMLGYYNNREATEAMIRLHSDGLYWVHSGDIGYMNENGSLFIVDRLKRMIVRYDGFKVFPSTIEGTIAKHKDVHECCVVGRSDTEHSQGKLPVAYVVLSDEGKNREEKIEGALINLCKNDLPEYALPVCFNFVEEIPYTPIGKVDYRTLEASAEAELH